MCYECFPESNSNPRLPNKPEQIPPPPSSSSFEDRRGPVCRAGFTTPCTHLSMQEKTGRALLTEKAGERVKRGKDGQEQTLFHSLIFLSNTPSNKSNLMSNDANLRVFKEFSSSLDCPDSVKRTTLEFSCVTLRQQTFLPSFPRPCQILQP